MQLYHAPSTLTHIYVDTQTHTHSLNSLYTYSIRMIDTSSDVKIDVDSDWAVVDNRLTSEWGWRWPGVAHAGACGYDCVLSVVVGIWWTYR